jgi:SPP1 gp7 family putative phage head morphogenesis protein
MTEVATYTEVQKRNYDPTHTTVLRNLFVRDMNRRFGELINVVKKSVVVNDCFGLNKTHILTLQMNPAAKDSFDYARSDKKVTAFMEWLDQQVKAGIITVQDMAQIGTGVEAVWTNKYIFDSYRRGVARARYEMIQAGMKIPTIEETGGIMASMSLPFHIDRVGLMFTRTFSDLKGVTDAMESIMSRILAQGMADGDGPILLARKLVAAINGEKIGELGLTDSLGRYISPKRRAEMIARTETIRAHHLATIQEYRNWGLFDIIVKGEWHTAGDDRVCSKCDALNGQIFTLDEIEPMIPLHPMCRCMALPYIEELQQYK